MTSLSNKGSLDLTGLESTEFYSLGTDDMLSSQLREALSLTGEMDNKEWGDNLHRNFL